MVDIATFKREYGLVLVGAIVFTASFLWRDLLSDVKDIYFPKYHGLAGRTIFTILVTIILVIVAIYIRDVLRLNQPSVTAIRFDSDPIDKSSDEITSDSNGSTSVLVNNSNTGSLSEITSSLGMSGVDGGIDVATTVTDNSDSASATD